MKPNKMIKVVTLTIVVETDPLHPKAHGRLKHACKTTNDALNLIQSFVDNHRERDVFKKGKEPKDVN